MLIVWAKMYLKFLLKEIFRSACGQLSYSSYNMIIA